MILRFKYILTTAIVIMVIPFASVSASADPAPALPFQDVTKSPAIRAADLVSRMTVQEKIEQLNNSAPAIPRLGIPAWEYWNEGLHGVLDSDATSFPVPASLGCSWDTALLYQVGSAISDEARIKYEMNKHGLDYWCPDINIQRDPRWGRNEEVYGEDPYQMSVLVVPFIKGMQGDDPNYFKTITTPKHFIANTTENDRDSINEVVDERSLQEYYLPPFHAAIVDGKADSIMAAYNAVNGTPMVCSQDFLTTLLRKQWGFTGYVVSDCGAVQDVYYNHKYVTDTGVTAALCLKAGMDMCCGNFTAWLSDAYKRGLITDSDLNMRVADVMEARIRLGSLDPDADCPYNNISPTKLCSVEFRHLALRAAQEGIVLLKNDHHLLPINRYRSQTIAVIGPDANRCILGGYSGEPRVLITPLQGIADALGVALPPTPQIIASTAAGPPDLRFQVSSEGPSNLAYIQSNSSAYFNNIDLTGKTEIAFRVASINKPAAPLPGIGADRLGNPATGLIEIHVDNLETPAIATVAIPSTGDWQTWTTVSTKIPPVIGKHTVYLRFIGPTYPFNLEWFEPLPVSSSALPSTRLTYSSGGVHVWNNNIDKDEFAKAVSNAKKADIAILVLGTDKDPGSVGESVDRSDLNLPGSQEQLIKAVYKVNPRTILVLVTGYSLALNWEKEHLPAILNTWYGGQEQGTAIASVLFGSYNPCGKLAQTWLTSAADLPDFHDNNITHNRTYLYFKGHPLYPFGYGLSYTTYEYSGIELSAATLRSGQHLLVTAMLKNSGKIAGDEIAQLYVTGPTLPVATPIKALKGFARVHLGAGQAKTVSFTVPYSSLSYWDTHLHRFIVEPGTYKVLVGRSSADLPLVAALNVK